MVATGGLLIFSWKQFLNFFVPLCVQRPRIVLNCLIYDESCFPMIVSFRDLWIIRSWSIIFFQSTVPRSLIYYFKCLWLGKSVRFPSFTFSSQSISVWSSAFTSSLCSSPAPTSQETQSSYESLHPSFFLFSTALIFLQLGVHRFKCCNILAN